jgi:hypothetical protein
MNSPVIFVDVPATSTAQLESWLLGHGRLPVVVPHRPKGRIRYLVEDADPHTVQQLERLGCEITRQRN